LAVVGAWGQTLLNQGGSTVKSFVGEAYVFERQFNSGTGEFEWNEIAQLAPFDVDRFHNEEFGFSMDISGETVVVGALRQSVLETIGDNSGEAYVFQRQGDDWILTEKLLPPVSQFNNQFGNSVAIDGLDIVVAQQSGDPGGLNAAGQIYTFEGALTSESVGLNLTGDDGDDVLVGGEGTDVMVGAAGDDTLDGTAGGNRLTGGVGDDLLVSGGGGDLFVFRTGDDADTIDGFVAGAGGGDTITLLGVNRGDPHHDDFLT
jgi:Ca2+-binding RTX toxin-like protein